MTLKSLRSLFRFRSISQKWDPALLVSESPSSASPVESLSPGISTKNRDSQEKQIPCSFVIKSTQPNVTVSSIDDALWTKALQTLSEKEGGAVRGFAKDCQIDDDLIVETIIQAIQEKRQTCEEKKMALPLRDAYNYVEGYSKQGVELAGEIQGSRGY
ncbi:hypothetical protein N7495_004655 [Penicillium taxi]|uniref:uncharacterized protein n=1 Tax=Penicillium taxi TaxID=168475 RepID=UPI0025450277|nr:uncharacterized protein N7495_004655 [Penicillium taxi]KAJ5899911.1 hypothetical protein N7495_004655 [Penicillium taxi]